MTAPRRGSVRIGPISLFTLIITLCLAVMAVLSVTTAQATYVAAERQALFTSDTYANERAAQEFTAKVDAALASVRAAGGGQAEARAAVERILPAGAKLDETTVRAEFTAESGRTLNVELIIEANATYRITAWKATTLWTDDSAGKTLWSGTASTR
ncbi:MAG: S4A5 electrogenic sodium bicarbonate cotransporter 4 [Gordonibacter sp.]|uniref:S4A5 electrogenic sodium bicarbonate cotransporter 4 n=1 Tax=Gordonibacter sp. TaxID=1968902 RepID=UPI002FCC9BD6